MNWRSISYDYFFPVKHIILMVFIEQCVDWIQLANKRLFHCNLSILKNTRINEKKKSIDYGKFRTCFSISSCWALIFSSRFSSFTLVLFGKFDDGGEEPAVESAATAFSIFAIFGQTLKKKAQNLK